MQNVDTDPGSEGENSVLFYSIFLSQEEGKRVGEKRKCPGARGSARRVVLSQLQAAVRHQGAGGLWALSVSRLRKALSLSLEV